MRFAAKLCATVAIGALLAEPAAAIPFQPVKPVSDSPIVQVQQRGQRGFVRGPRAVNRGARVGNRGFRGRGGRGGGGGGGGAAAAGAIIGLAVGAMIAAEAQRQNDAIAWCSQRFRSYDPYSMTYVGRDGRRHRCP